MKTKGFQTRLFGGDYLSSFHHFLKWLVVAVIAGAPSLYMAAAHAQGVSAEDLFARARALDYGAGTDRSSMEQISDIFERVIEEQPSSDLAVQILLRGVVDGYDIGDFYHRLEGGEASTSPRGTLACLSKLQTQRSGRSLRVDVVTDAAGMIDGLPELVLPEDPDGKDRQSYLALVSALDTCAPLTESGTALSIMVPPVGDLMISTTVPTAALTPTPQMPILPLPQVVHSSANEMDERALGLSKQDIRDLQARLLVLGHNPNGIDGAIGKGTRRAISAWQAEGGASAPTGFIGRDQMARLKAQSEAALKDWLKAPDNARLYQPPPPIALGPRNVPGNWRYTSTCGSKSRLGKKKITGALVLSHAGGNRYTGRISNSQGLRGTFSGTLKGRQLNGTVNWGVFIGKTTISGRVADQKLTLSGRDSLGCRLYAYKS
ncbi:MAG: peptidoglycan-binding domain-containing protein [Sphingomonadaceae bacterium]